MVAFIFVIAMAFLLPVKQDVGYLPPPRPAAIQNAGKVGRILVVVNAVISSIVLFLATVFSDLFLYLFLLGLFGG